jgi:hypothetical protein
MKKANLPESRRNERAMGKKFEALAKKDRGQRALRPANPTPQKPQQEET